MAGIISPNKPSWVEAEGEDQDALLEHVHASHLLDVQVNGDFKAESFVEASANIDSLLALSNTFGITFLGTPSGA